MESANVKDNKGLSRRQFAKIAALATGGFFVPTMVMPQWAQAGEPGSAAWLPRSRRSGIRPLVCEYDGVRLGSAQVVDGLLQTDSAQWGCSVREQGAQVEVTFKLLRGAAQASGVAVAFDVADWSRDHYLMVPAAVYGGNRFNALGGGYMPVYPPDMFDNPKLPLTISNNPRLSIAPGEASTIELLTGNASTPAIALFDRKAKRGFVLLTEQKSRFGNHGLIIAENAAQDQLSLVVSAPGVRSRIANFGGFRASDDAAADWKVGDELTLKFQRYSFAAADIPAFLEKFNALRQSLTGPARPRNLVPMSRMAAAILPRFKQRWHETPHGNYYLCDINEDFKLGWVGGGMQTPMLAIDDPVERDRIGQQCDFIVERLQAKNGLFHCGIGVAGNILDSRQHEGRNVILVRQNADALLGFFKFFEIYKAQGHAQLIKPAWEEAARRLAQALVDVWRRHGELGQYLDVETGEIAVFNSTNGAIVPAALAAASRHFGDPDFLEAAKAIADFYYRRDVLGRGLTAGGCGDTSQDPDSESAFGLLASMMALHAATEDRAWLRKARDVAQLCATWVLSYDHEFPEASQIARLQGHMGGAVFASVQNKHAAPGICTGSADPLFKLYRATGEAFFAELLRDIQHAHTEATEMPGHVTCGAGEGASNERIQPSDAEGRGGVGNYVTSRDINNPVEYVGGEHVWCQLGGLMMAMELPGIYAQTDGDGFFVFDHVDAEVVGRDAEGIAIKVHNRTPYPARIKVLAERAAQSRKPLEGTAYLHWPEIPVDAGQSAIYRISHDGKIVQA